jgi:hypothetical protein
MVGSDWLSDLIMCLTAVPITPLTAFSGNNNY